MEIAIRNLNQMGVFTVFIILDSLSKVGSSDLYNYVVLNCKTLYLIHCDMYNHACFFSSLQDSIVDIKVPTFIPGKVLYMTLYIIMCV